MRPTLLTSMLLCAACAHAQPKLAEAIDDSLVVGTLPTGEAPAAPGEVELLGGLLVGRVPSHAVQFHLPPENPQQAGVLDVTVYDSPLPGGGSLAIALSNHYALATDDFAPSDRSAYTGDPTAPGRPLLKQRGVGDGRLVLYPFAADTLEPEHGKSPLAGAWVVLPDHFVIHAVVFTLDVRQDQFEAARDRAQALLRSLRVGPRQIDLTGSRRALHGHLALTLPAGLVIHYTHMQGKDDYVVERPSPVGHGRRLRMTLTLGPSLPEFPTWPGWSDSVGQLLGRSVTWHAHDDRTQGLLQLVTFVHGAIEGQVAMVGVQAPTEAELLALRPYAETLDLDPPLSPNVSDAR